MSSESRQSGSPGVPPHRYTAALAGELELRWQAAWEEQRTFKAPNPGEEGFDASRPKFYCLDMFPYPSGAGLHVGHPEGYTATDIVCRYMRMRGYNVLHPMGWDAFGLPAEQYAIQTGIHPAKTTRSAIETFRRQLKRFGFSYDWSREIATIDPDYYRWTQWIFLQMYNSWYDQQADRARPIAELMAELESGNIGISFEGDLVTLQGREGSNIPGLTGQSVGLRMWHQLSQEERRAFIDAQRLAFVSEQTVNWCPKLGTVLANEEVIDGRSERGGFPVYRKSLKQWMLRITAYADRLLGDLSTVEWPESTRTMQAEWIGRSEGAEVDFELVDGAQGEYEAIRVYTTRPDTIFGATYMVIAPEHPLVQAVLDAPPPGMDVAAVRAYVEQARSRGEVERQAEGKDKTGVYTGLQARNPASGAEIPVWIADYVLMGYGHGAIMAVPGHDQRDFDFARAFDLPVRDVVYPRSIAAMQYFALHATPADVEGDQWRERLAAFLQIVTMNDTWPGGFGEALARARAEAAAPSPVDPAVREHELPAAARLGPGAGAKWLDVIDALELRSFLDLRGRFERAAFHRESDEPYQGTGFNVNSANESVSLDGLPTGEAKERITAWLDEQGLGRKKVNYKLRDWLFSRQRYWGEPFPIVWDDRGNHYPVSEGALPVRLPEMEQFRPPESDDPAPMLAGAPREWLATTAGDAGVDPALLPPERMVRRETNTMPNWAGSCWYYLRYCDPANPGQLIGGDAERYWMGQSGVDLYIGGAEHAVLHLLYARFWHKVLYDLGYVTSPEPMRRLFHQGLITSYAYRDSTGRTVPIDEVEVRDGRQLLKATGEEVQQITAKMSKTLKNVVNPDDVIAEFGADTFRIYEMYMGPLESSKPWNPRDITGLFRFLQRVWRLVIDEETGRLRIAEVRSAELERELHRMISRVGPGIERLALNTAIAAMIEFVNAATSAASGAGTGGGIGGGMGGGTGGGVLVRDQVDRLALVLSPFAPHMAEEIWSRLGHSESLAYEPWPAHDESLLREAGVEIPVQVNGKVRGRITVAADAPAAQIEAASLADERVREHLEGKSIAKVIVIPGKMVNIVAK